MIIAILTVVGLSLGSFVNALVWRLHEQATETGKPKSDKSYLQRLSISRGRSMCSHCHHELAVRDLIPVLSWLSLRGKCRYCHKPIADSPLVELLTPALFVISYIYWPVSLLQASASSVAPSLFHGAAWQANLYFGLWLVLLVGLVALLVYDLRWLLLPNRLVYPLGVITVLMAIITITTATRPGLALVNTLLAVAVGGGIFYVIFQISGGKWIGGGDVKLGWLLGLVVGTAGRSLLLIFIAALLGSLLSIPLLLTKRLKSSSIVPFGPFLILAAVLVQLFGASLLHWYQFSLLGGFGG